MPKNIIQKINLNELVDLWNVCLSVIFKRFQRLNQFESRNEGEALVEGAPVCLRFFRSYQNVKK